MQESAPATDVTTKRRRALNSRRWKICILPTDTAEFPTEEITRA